MNDTILVAGGAGYIGGHVVRVLRQRGFNVVIIDNFSNSTRGYVPDGVDVVEGHKGDRDLVRQILADRKPIGVIDLGGYADIWEKKFTPSQFYQNNVVETVRFADTILTSGISNYVFSSSAQVYGQTTNDPIPESHARMPLSIYARTMQACEDVVTDLFGGSDTGTMILRYFNVAGAMDDLSFGPTMPNYYHVMAAALNVAFGVVEKVNAYGNDFETPDGTGITDFIHVQDLADIHVRALTRLIEGGDSDTINCGYGHGRSVLQVIEAVSRISGKEIPTNFADRRGNFGGIAVVDASKLLSSWNWTPQFDDLDVMVKHAYLWRKQLAEKG